MPFFKSFSFLKTLFVSSSKSESPKEQSSRTEAPATHLLIMAWITPAQKLIIMLILVNVTIEDFDCEI